MTQFFLSIYDFFAKRKILATLLLIAIIALCVILALKLKYKENIADFLPHDEASERYTDIYQRLGDQGRITIIFRHIDTTLDIAQRQEEIMSAMDLFQDNCNDALQSDTVLGPIDLKVNAEETDVFEAMDFIRNNIALFLNDQDYRRADSLLAQPNYIDSSLRNVKQLMANPMGGFAIDAISADPLNIFSPALKRLQSLNLSDHYEIIDGYIFDLEGNGYAFMTAQDISTSDSYKNNRLNKIIRQAIDASQNETVKISAVGAGLIAATNANQIKNDSFLATAIATLLIFVILLWAMGHKRNILWLGFSVAAGWLFALAAIALFRPSISIIVIGIGTVLVGIAVNYPLHFLDHIREITDRRSALKEMVEPLVTGNITTVSAFACLIFVHADAMRDLGLFSSLMLIGTILFVMIFLPHFAKTGRKSHRTIRFVKTIRPIHLPKTPLLIGILLLTIFFGYFSTKTSFDSDLHNINFMTPQQKDDLQLLSHTIDNNDASLAYIVSEAPTLDSAMLLCENALPHIHSAGFTDISGIVGIMPSLQQQQQNIEGWQRFVTNHPMLSKQVLSNANSLGFTPSAFDPFYTSLSQSYSPISMGDMKCLRSVCDSYILNDNGNYNIVSFAHSTPEQIDHSVATFRQSTDDHSNLFAFSIKDVGNNLVRTLNDDFNYILYVCGLVVFFFLWLSFGRIELALLAFLPLTVGWLWILGIMSLTAVKFNIVNIILATFIFGQGDDYTIFITEGLMYEYAYGKKRLRSYRRSVIISALLMFVGIGVLIFAKHPAMRSLGEVAVIGMATVILMACFLPPVIYRWMTMHDGKRRNVPITLRRILYTTAMLLVFFIAAFVVVTPFTIFYRLIGRDSAEKRLRFHRIIAWFCRQAMHCLPGVRHTIENAYGEDFNRPAVIIANHQSHLDLLCMLLLTPKMVILTADWVWRNPIYGLIIRYAEFYPASNGYEASLPHLQRLASQGYSIMVFPEGTRSMDGRIGRYHKGAFYLAQQLHLDILPILLHGCDHVMPKRDILLREGHITTIIGKRIAYNEIKDRNLQDLASEMRHTMQQQLDKERHRLQTEEYFLPYVRYQYIYKGRSIERRCRKTLKLVKSNLTNGKLDISQITNQNSIILPNIGELPLLLALAHPDQQFHYEFDNEDDYLVASNCAIAPANLHYSLKDQ